MLLLMALLAPAALLAIIIGFGADTRDGADGSSCQGRRQPRPNVWW